MALNKIDEAAHRPWNPKGSLPVHQWLVQSQSNMDVLRLKACGNSNSAMRHFGLERVGSSIEFQRLRF